MAIQQKKLVRFGKGLKGFTPPPTPPLRAGRGERTLKADLLKDPKDEPPFYIRGVKADSKEEYWVSLSLERIEELTGWTWRYQVPVYGGRDVAGGNVVDFLVDTPGMPTMLEPMSRYHHTGRYEDRYQMENVARKKNWNLVAWFTDETPTRESVHQFLLRKLYV